MWNVGMTTDKLKSLMIGIILVLITVVVAIQLIANLTPTVLLAFGNLGAVSGLSFNTFYQANGVANIVFGAVVLVAVISLILLLLGGKGSR